MLTAGERAWMRASLGHIGRCRKGCRQKMSMSRAPAPPALQLCGEGVKHSADTWYSGKTKKKAISSPVEEGTGGSVTSEADMAAGEDMASTPCVCSDCGTSRTPLWRRGPAGPKSLCNACGIRYRKTKRWAGPSSTADPSRMNCGGRRKIHAAARKVTPGMAPPVELMKEEKMRRRREMLWLLMEESRKLELPCGKEAVEAAMLLMAMSSGLFVHTC